MLPSRGDILTLGGAMAKPTDTLFSTQWHLHNTRDGEFDLNVLGVWSKYTGAGVKVMVLDNGFDRVHEDLVANYDTALDRDYFDLDNNAQRSDADGDHGTATMGLIGAARNGIGVVGVAYGATMIGARMGFPADPDRYSTQIVSALGDAVAKDIDVVNMSIGGGGDYDAYFGAANVARIKTALENAVAQGRDGLGVAVVKAAGNDRGSFIDVNHTQPDSDTRQIIVAAVNRDGFVSEYSSYGAPILVSAFGSPLAGEIVTTDITGSAGYADGNYASDFNGTSAATPEVSGVVALMLDANDDLGWRDIQSILAISARHVGSAVGGFASGNETHLWQRGSGNSWNGGGMHYSLDYGYGLVDALAAVRLAESWTLQSTSANQAKAKIDLLDAPVTLPDGASDGRPFSGAISADLQVERVVVTVNVNLAVASDFRCVLVGPDGREQELIASAGGDAGASGAYSFHAQGFRGMSSAGNWSVRLADVVPGDACTVSDVKISVFGAKGGKNDVYYYTNEFSDFASSRSKALVDGDGGRDLLNVAAVSSDTRIDLTQGKGRIDGVAVTLKGVNDVLSGVGDDRLVGSKGANALSGGRGDDILTGGAGEDRLSGGSGEDRFVFRSKADSVVGGDRDLITDFTGADLIDLSAIDAKSGSGNDAFRFIKTADFHDRAGELHAVRIDKSGSSKDLTLIEGDINGDGKADFQIALKGLHTLTAGDFAL